MAESFEKGMGDGPGQFQPVSGEPKAVAQGYNYNYNGVLAFPDFVIQPFNYGPDRKPQHEDKVIEASVNLFFDLAYRAHKEFMASPQYVNLFSMVSHSHKWKQQCFFF